MIYLALSILCSSAIFVLFSYFAKYKVQLVPAIVTNYLIAAASGFVQVESVDSFYNIPNEWWIFAFLISFLFISLFYLMAKTAQELGVSVSSNATKMSMLIPIVLLALIYPSEHLNYLQVIGVILALFGIYYTSIKGDSSFKLKYIFWPFILFAGSGLLDFLLAYANQNLLHSAADDRLFTSLSFGLAFIWGLFIILYQYLLKKEKIRLVSVVGGVILGVVNFGSIYFLLRTYASNIAQKTTILPVNNMAIIILSTLLSILLFHEKLSRKNIIGLSLSLLSILLIFFNA